MNKHIQKILKEKKWLILLPHDSTNIYNKIADELKKAGFDAEHLKDKGDVSYIRKYRLTDTRRGTEPDMEPLEAAKKILGDMLEPIEEYTILPYKQILEIETEPDENGNLW